MNNMKRPAKGEIIYKYMQDSSSLGEKKLFSSATRKAIWILNIKEVYLRQGEEGKA